MDVFRCDMAIDWQEREGIIFRGTGNSKIAYVSAGDEKEARDIFVKMLDISISDFSLIQITRCQIFRKSDF